MVKYFCFFGLLMASSLWAVTPPTELQEFPKSRLIPTEWGDGDSFLVEIEPGRQEVLRLHFVDCPETSATTETDQRRVRGQSSYFGVSSHRTTLKFGQLTKAEVQKLLEKPFTVSTAFSRALGRSAKPRYYAFVTMENGHDLGEYLVSHGLARSFGVGRATKDGVSSDDAKSKMNDLEMGAAIGRQGIWAETNPENLVAMREKDREEAQKLKEDFDLAKDEKLNPNKASVDELMLLPGIGRVLAERIVEGRPYSSVEDLRHIAGLSAKKFESLKSRWNVNP